MANYKTVFSITLDHDFYIDRRCPELAIQATPACRELLAGRRFITKNKLNTFSVIAPFNGDEPDFDTQDRTVFSFTVQLLKPNFMLFTDLAVLGDSRPYRFVNTASQTELQIINNEPDFVENGSFATIEVDSALVYADLTQGPKEYYYRFVPVAEPWRYYLVTNYEGNNFELEHDPQDADLPLTFTKNTLDDANTEDDPFAQSLVRRYPDAMRYLFTSTTAIPYREQGFRDIQIKKDGAVWLTHLPNPHCQDNGVRLIQMMTE